MEFEDILKQVGDYGPYQRRLLYGFLVPSSVIFAILCMNTFFMLSEPESACLVPQLQNLSIEDQIFLTRKAPLQSLGLGNVSLLKDSCYIYDIDYGYELQRFTDHKNMFNKTDGFVLSYYDHTIKSNKCSDWKFDKTNYDSNAVTDLKLVCDKAHWKSLIQTIHGMGEVLGNPFFGTLSDHFGRHLITFVAIGTALVSSCSPIIFRGLIVFAIFRFMNSFTTASLFNLPFILTTELVGPEHRTKLIGLTACCWTVGMCLVSLVAFLTRDWVMLTIVPTLLVAPMFAFWNVLPESPRWLLSKGRYQEAYDVMAKIAVANGKTVPSDLMEQLVSLNRRKEKTRRASSIGASNRRRSSISAELIEEGSIMDLFRYPGIRKHFLIMTFAWTANVCTYRGLTLNFENFHGNEFLNWLLLSVVEFPSNLLSWFFMGTILGRRWTNSVSMIAGGLSLCLPIIIPSSYGNAIIIASLVGKFLCNMAYNAVYQQTAELFPTPVRNQAMSFSTAIAAGANFALPFLVSLGKVHVWIPLIVMGITAISSGVAVAFLPETLNENLPQTLQDGDSFGSDQVFFSFAKTKKHGTRNDEKNGKIDAKDVESNGLKDVEVFMLTPTNHTQPSSSEKDTIDT